MAAPVFRVRCGRQRGRLFGRRRRIGEIDQVALSPGSQRTALVLQRRRHREAARLPRQRFRRLAPGAGGVQLHRVGSRFRFGRGAVAMLRSDPHQPARAAIVSARGGRRSQISGLAPINRPKRFSVRGIASISRRRTDSRSTVSSFFRRDGGRLSIPRVVFFHGGSRRQMLLGWHPMFYYYQAYGFNSTWRAGYIVLVGQLPQRHRLRTRIFAKPSITARPAAANTMTFWAPGSICARAPM